MKLNTLVVLVCASAGLCLAAGTPRSHLARIPLHFEPAPDSRFVARADGYLIAVSSTDAAIRTLAGGVTISWLDSRSAARADAEQPLGGRSHYFLGPDPSRWRTNVPHYGAVRVRGLYDGVDALYYGHGREVEFDLVVAPEADLGRVRYRIGGGGVPRVDAAGDVVVSLPEGELRLRRPRIFQGAGAERRSVEGRYTLAANGEVGFAVGDHDPAAPLVIDPVIVYATYLGGSDIDRVNSLATDAQGNVYVTGETHSADFPASAFKSVPANGNPPGDVFVTKINPEGTAVLWSAVFGGSSMDRGNDIAVGVDNSVYVAGYTASTDFPVENGPQTKLGDTAGGAWGDAFAVRLGPGGNLLVYSTYLGGSGSDEGTGIAIGPGGDLYVAGYTESDDIATTAGVLQTAKNGQLGADGFLARLRSAGPEVVYTTYLGGGNNDVINDIAVDTDGNAYVTGRTSSPDFPVSANAYQRDPAGGDQFILPDAFVTKVKPDGTGVVFSTFLGGSGSDEGHDIGLDSFTHVYVAGETNSTDFPVTAGAAQGTIADGGAASDAFVTKLDRSGATLGWSTYFGGSGTDAAYAMAVTFEGEIVLAGETDSTDLPTAASDCPMRLPQGGRDAFVARFSHAGAAMWAAYLGGSEADRGNGVALGASGDVYVGGTTDSWNLPVSGGALRTAAESTEGFVARLSDEVSDAVACISGPGVVNAASYVAAPVAPGEIINVFGMGIGPATLATAQYVDNRMTTDLEGVRLLFDDVPAPLVYVQAGVLSGIVPYAVDGQQTTDVHVEYNGEVSNTVTVPVGVSAPGIFSLNATGRGQGAVLNYPDYSVNGPGNPIEAGGIVMIYATGEGQTSPPGVDGRLTIDTYPSVSVDQVSVRIGGIEVTPLYAGSAYGLVAGVIQVNVVVPDNVEPGDAVPVILKIRGRTSQPGITIAVQ